MKTRPLNCLFQLVNNTSFSTSHHAQRCEILHSDSLCSDWSLFWRFSFYQVRVYVQMGSIGMVCVQRVDQVNLYPQAVLLWKTNRPYLSSLAGRDFTSRARSARRCACRMSLVGDTTLSRNSPYASSSTVAPSWTCTIRSSMRTWTWSMSWCLRGSWHGVRSSDPQ